VIAQHPVRDPVKDPLILKDQPFESRGLSREAAGDDGGVIFVLVQGHAAGPIRRKVGWFIAYAGWML